MNSPHPITRLHRYVLIYLAFLVLAGCVHAIPAGAATGTQAEPAVYLDFNEGSGNIALDASGHGDAGTLYGPTRTESGGCGGALVFNGENAYVTIPPSTLNHPTQEITVSTWFYVDQLEPQTLVSAYKDGGYQLGFDDGNDLYWTVNLVGTGDVSVAVLHEGITPRQWHYVTGTYDGNILKIYLDGVLRNQVNASGTINYEYNNYVILGADAGTDSAPDTPCPHYLQGGLDEVRIYNVALEYSQVMDDRFRCSPAPGTLSHEPPNATAISPACTINSGSVLLGNGDTIARTLVFTDKNQNGTWQVSVPPGSRLVVGADDRYSTTSPDSWYIEIADSRGRIDRSVAFPNTHNTPIEGVIPSGNATVTVHYFDGTYRFPVSVAVWFQSVPAPQLPPIIIPQNILTNPIIAIYSASWATLIAVLLVVIWLHRRRSERRKEETGAGKEKE
ncbi:LamG domain-containing protein [Methanoregula sp.]|uniref:LamG domain-containing protein n=1 Tax=Methanoregula sp. TaxID=2052170 RepID=UPI003C792261